MTTPKDTAGLASVVQELLACKHSDPYATKSWAPEQKGRWFTVNVPQELWARLASLPSPATGGLTDLPAAILAIQPEPKTVAQMDGHPKGFYLVGHRDARRAAAELARAILAAAPPPAMGALREPNSEQVHLAQGDRTRTTGQAEDEDVDAVIACLGDDAQALREIGASIAADYGTSYTVPPEIIDNMERAAVLLQKLAAAPQAERDEAVDADLWAVNVRGPDDLYATPSRAAALELANELNVHFGKLDENRHEYDPFMRAVVIKWEHNAASHAAALARDAALKGGA